MPNRARTCHDAVRRLGAFLNAEDPRHEVPPAGAFGCGKHPRPAPHLLDPGQIRAILRAALDLEPKGSISPFTFHYLFGLLAATGMRVSEALALNVGDIGSDGLTIRHGKFGKSRLLPIHASTRAALAEYTVIRRDLRASGDNFFVLGSGRAPSKIRAHAVFVEIARSLGMRPRDLRSPGPRLHDLRHSFAVRSLEACLHDRKAVAHHMAGLSTYLGHTSMAHTYWYAAGLRVSELLAVQTGDFQDRSLAMARVLGMGRRERVLPLWQETRTALRAWFAVRFSVQVTELFVNREGLPLSRDGFAHRPAIHVAAAAKKRPALLEKRVTPHVLRYSCAMHTLEATGDIRKVSLRLGYASLQSTEAYLRVDPAEKLAILAANAPPAVPKGRFRTPDKLLAMLAEIQKSR